MEIEVAASLGEAIISVQIQLLRHAKARFATPGVSDFDRPLEESGLADAEAMGARMRQEDWVPELALCSTGLRARQTWGATERTLQSGATVRYLDGLYSEDASGYLKRLKHSGAERSVILIGHNPMIEDLALALAAPDDAILGRIRNTGFATAGLAIFTFDDAIDQLAPGHATAVDFLRPADL